MTVDPLRVAGFDMGRKYVAFSVLEYTEELGYTPVRHGLIFPPDIGDTDNFGYSLKQWEYEFQNFVENDLEVSLYGIERFTYRPGSQGQSAEEINLRIVGMQGTGSVNIRNTEWKSWFKRNVCADGAEAFYGFSTPHECDAAGIGLYTAVKRSQRVKTNNK